jgi:peptide deformylase
MVLPVVKYGNPVLRQRGAPVAKLDDALRRLVADMFDTMYSAKGIGLAAQQVGQAVQLAVLDLRGIKDRPSQLWVQGHPADVDAFMPLVLINPVIRPVGEAQEGPEGCLSFPEIYGEIVRPAEVEVSALNERGESFEFRAGGLLSRAIQHEVDHLNGLLFIDRMSASVRNEVRDEVDRLQADTKKALGRSRR